MIVCPKCLKGYHPKVNFCPLCNIPLPKAGTEGVPAASAFATTIPLRAAAAAETAPASPQPTPAPVAPPPPQAAQIPSEPVPEKKPGPTPSVSFQHLKESAATDAGRLEKTDTRPPAEEMDTARAEVAAAMEELKEAAGLVTMSRRHSLELVANLNRIFVEGTGVILTFRLTGGTAGPLKDVHLKVSSDKALVQAVDHRATWIEPGQPEEIMIEAELAPNSRGERMLNCEVAFSQLGRRKVMRGMLRLRILKEPSETNLKIDLSNIGNQVVTGESNAGLGGEQHSNLQIKDLVDFSKIKTLNDLLSAELPDQWTGISLRQVSDEPTGARMIASPFLKKVQEGGVLTLEAGGDAPGLRFTARPQFVFGRQRDVCDLVTWFLPRSPENDEFTRSMSKVHVFAAASAQGIFFRTPPETNGATLSTPERSRKLRTLEPGEKFEEFARLSMSAGPGVSFTVDILHHEAEGSVPPTADNDALWPGPPVEEKFATGCIVLRPVHRPPAFRNCLWLFTEAAFGSDEGLPLYIPDPGLASVQGRIHHYRGCFWVENSAPGNAVSVDGTVLRPGELAPLCTGMKVRLGKMEFTARVET
jgi:hypothetical protein